MLKAVAPPRLSGLKGRASALCDAPPPRRGGRRGSPMPMRHAMLRPVPVFTPVRRRRLVRSRRSQRPGPYLSVVYKCGGGNPGVVDAWLASLGDRNHRDGDILGKSAFERASLLALPGQHLGQIIPQPLSLPRSMIVHTHTQRNSTLNSVAVGWFDPSAGSCSAP